MKNRTAKAAAAKAAAAPPAPKSPAVSLDLIAGISRNVEEGGWVSAIPNLPGVAIKARGRHNSDYSRRQLELMAELNPTGKDDPELDFKIETVLLAETILVDWNIDAPIDDAITILADPKYTVLRRGVLFASNVVATLGTSSLEADAKN